MTQSMNIALRQAHIRFPIYESDDRSFKRTLLSAAGGRILKGDIDRVEIEALNNINLSIGQDEKVALLGHNGSGKTTLLRVLAGVYTPVCGEVAISGRVTSLLDSMLGMDAELTGLENIQMRLLLMGKNKQQTEALTDSSLNTGCEPAMEDNVDYVFWSGPLDAWFDHRLGRLGYLTLDFEKITAQGDYQGNSVVNYCDAEYPYTRITEHRHFSPWESHEETLCYREHRQGQLVERACLHYDLDRWWIANPRRDSIGDLYPNSESIPHRLSLAFATFEGLFIHRNVVKAVGWPDPNYFIFLDDVDYSLRIRRAGYAIRLARKAILQRQLDLVDVTELNWKSGYIYRNFFYIHFTYGNNWAVRHKPFLLVLAATFIKPFTLNGYRELPIIWRALFDACKMNCQPRQSRIEALFCND